MNGAETAEKGWNKVQLLAWKVYRGLASLRTGLKYASGQLRSASTEPKNAEILSIPLSLSKQTMIEVPVNGIAMAPYMISVALLLQ